ncbi:MAG: sigma-70 family RNA polymerase sigma factor [Propionibacteriales bacterium]|nr:sigma-70 family RNA polymerase sigma factor [Propionibacteriales bacterium]
MFSTDQAGRTAPAAAPSTTISERRQVTEAAFDRIRRREDPDIRHRALEQVVLANLGVARSLAAAHRDKGIPREDLEQVAYAALVAAADRFRPEEGRDFLAFAVPTIRGELKRHFRDCGWTVRPPRRVQEIQLRVLAARDLLAKSLDRPPTASELAQALGESEHHVTEALRLDGCFAPSSLDLPLGSGTATRGDLLPDTGIDDQEAAEARVMLGPAVRDLGERDRYVVRLRYFDGLTQQEIGNELGVSQTQVSRILGRITRELRECLTPPCEFSSDDLRRTAG